MEMKDIVLLAGANDVEDDYAQLDAVREQLDAMAHLDPPAIPDEDWLAVPPQDRAVMVKLAINAKCRFHEDEAEREFSEAIAEVLEVLKS